MCDEILSLLALWNKTQSFRNLAMVKIVFMGLQVSAYALSEWKNILASSKGGPRVARHATGKIIMILFHHNLSFVTLFEVRFEAFES